MSKLRRRKLLRRALTVLQNAAHQLMQPFLNIVISALVIRLTSEAVWGEFISVLILVQLAAHIAGWGNREYLLRAFSQNPQHIRQQWQSSLSSRAVIAVLLCGFTVFLAGSLTQMAVLFAWILLLVVSTSFNVLIVYRKAFGVAIVTELALTVIRAVVILRVGAALTMWQLVTLFVATVALKAAVYLWHFRDVLRPPHWQIDTTHYRLAFPFFLLGFSGILASRTDLYAVSLFADDAEVGRYQVFINLMLYVQALTQFILLPYVKTLYRIEDASLHKISRRLFLFGMVIVPPALLAAHLMLRVVYAFSFDVAFFVIGGLFVLPIYGYLPLIHRLYKLNQQNNVLWANVLGAVFNLVGNVLLLPLIGLHGALLSSAIMQWGMFAYYFISAREHHEPTLSGVPTAT